VEISEGHAGVFENNVRMECHTTVRFYTVHEWRLNPKIANPGNLVVSSVAFRDDTDRVRFRLAQADLGATSVIHSIIPGTYELGSIPHADPEPGRSTVKSTV
jgi:hypothetical protein